MATKTCPNCGAEVPLAATRCKHCFYEFEKSPKNRSSGLLLILGLVVAMVLSGAGVMYYLLNVQSVKRNVVIDQETHSIVWTRTYADKVETERLPFDDVVKVEHIFGGKDATFEVVVITTNGERKVLNQSDDAPLTSYAEHVAHVMDKPFLNIRKVKGFGEKYGKGSKDVEEELDHP